MNQPFGFSASGDDRDDHDSNKGKGGDSGNSGDSSASQGGSGQGGSGGNSGNGGFDFGFAFPGAGGAGGAGGSGQSGFPGDLGALLNQFGQMLGNVGSAINSGGDGPINYKLAEQVALGAVSKDTHATEKQTSAVTEALRLAELWLDDTTEFPVAAHLTEAWTPRTWVQKSLPTWKDVASPLAEHVNEASMQSMPEEARKAAGPLLSMLQSAGQAGFGMQLGQGLAALAPEVLFSSEIGIPFAPDGTAALLPAAISEFAKELELPAQEVMVFCALREAAHVRLYAAAPWLRSRMVSTIEEYARGIRIDTSSIDDLAGKLGGGLDPSILSDPQKMQELLGGGDIGPKISNVNEQAAHRLETMLALVEGWVDVVVTTAIDDRLPSSSALRETWIRRRATGGAAEKTFAQLVGLEMRPRMAREAATMWQRITDAVGTTDRDRLWSHPDLLPGAEDITNPAAVIDRLLAADEEASKIAGGSAADGSKSSSESVDPFEEIENFLREQAGEAPKGGQNDSGATDGSGGTDGTDGSGTTDDSDGGDPSGTDSR
ncbi:zinc-dependent metalloprotease [Dietzia sp.]|uniref:zinc-dependent metalloprotease n=1 Tax=Dietzia sp. TaxID=1871616 RepID=UPI002FDAA7B5